VATSTWAELATRDAGSWFSTAFAGERVPRYEDVVRFCQAHDVWMNVEIKPAPGFEVLTGRIVGEITGRLFADQSGGAGSPLFSSFSIAALASARAVAPQVPRGLLFDALPEIGIEAAHALGCISVHANHRRLREEEIARLHDAGLAVMSYTVNEQRRAEQLAGWGVDAICTDRIDLLRP
jgi:glycerophosphoryl diester phosphodiesterase